MLADARWFECLRQTNDGLPAAPEHRTFAWQSVAELLVPARGYAGPTKHTSYLRVPRTRLLHRPAA